VKRFGRLRLMRVQTFNPTDPGFFLYIPEGVGLAGRRLVCPLERYELL
jgi:hypothetical protein